ncbi:MAG: amidohydrolase family protein [Phycisphaerales bacterium]
MSVAAAAIFTGVLAGATLAAEPPEKIALTGGRIVPVVGEEIEKGTIVIERGRIVAIGADVEIPYDATEIDVTGRVLMPGMIDVHTARGMDIQNENVPVAPFLDVYDAIDPSQTFFEDALRMGVTSVHVMPGNNTVIGGVSRVVRPIGLTISEMTVQPGVGLKLSATPRNGFDRMQQLAVLREAFLELDDYLGLLAETRYEEEQKKADKKVDVMPDEARKRGRELVRDEDLDDKHANLVRLRRGDLAAWIYVGAPTDVAPAIDIAQAQELKDHSVLVLGPETFRAVNELARFDRPVVLDENLTWRERDPITGELEEIFIPSRIYDAGLTFALQSNPGASMAEGYLNYQAAMCVRNGIPRQTALEAITLTPANMLGLSDRLGSLEVGKTANIVVMSGDPLDFSTWVEQVYIDGILAYDRSKDRRLAKLVALEESNRAQLEKAAAEETAAAEPEVEADAEADAESNESEAKPADESAPNAEEAVTPQRRRRGGQRDGQPGGNSSVSDNANDDGRTSE